MKEGVGNVPIIAIIIVFIAFVSGYLAYNVNYTKAFRMKNKIIALYEEYDGECGGTCKSKILDYAQEIGYTASSLDDSDCTDPRFYPEGYPANAVSTQTFQAYGYCEYKINTNYRTPGTIVDVVDDCSDSYYYRILTKIDIRIPIIENVMNLRVLNVTGNTKTFGGC